MGWKEELPERAVENRSWSDRASLEHSMIGLIKSEW